MNGIVLVAGLLLGATINYTWRFASSASAPDDAAASVVSSCDCRRKTGAVETSRVPPPVPGGASPAGASATPLADVSRTDDRGNADEKHRRQQSRELVRILRDRTRLAKMMPNTDSVEAIANEVDSYQQGWTDALMAGSPELIDEMANEIEALMCNPSAENVEEAEVVVLTRVLAQMPELSNRKGLDCLLARESEDFVTWSALDAWTAAADRLGTSDGLTNLAARARDDRTLRRLAEIRQRTSF